MEEPGSVYVEVPRGTVIPDTLHCLVHSDSTPRLWATKGCLCIIHIVLTKPSTAVWCVVTIRILNMSWMAGAVLSTLRVFINSITPQNSQKNAKIHMFMDLLGMQRWKDWGTENRVIYGLLIKVPDAHNSQSQTRTKLGARNSIQSVWQRPQSLDCHLLPFTLVNRKLDLQLSSQDSNWHYDMRRLYAK